MPMDFLALFYAPMMLASARPAAPFILAAIFGLAQLVLLLRHRQRPVMLLWRRPALFAAAIWVVYGLYELQVQATTPSANIRIDLLVLAPILYVFTAVAIWWVWREWHAPHVEVMAQGDVASRDASEPGQDNTPGQ
jgi:hypothetical protein